MAKMTIYQVFVNVTFTRTGERRYRVSVEGPGVVSSWMEPAPGYDARLPHDMAPFVVENELGIKGGIFGQLAAGGGTLTPEDLSTIRAVRKKGFKMHKANRNDAEMTEKIIHLACSTWNNDLDFASPVKGVSDEDIKRICREFDAVSAVWSKLQVGGSMTLTWTADRAASNKDRSKRK